MTSLVAIGRLFTGVEAWPNDLIYRSRLLLILLAVGLPLTSAPYARTPLPLPGSISVFAADLIVLGALGLWALEKLLSRDAVVQARSPLLGWPLLLFGLTLIPGVWRGHERYGVSLVGQPVRLVLYAAIALAVLRVRPREIYVGLTAVLYAGTVWQLALAGYSLVAGESQTGSSLLSTGGTRVLSLGAGMYLAAALLIALLNLEFDQGRRRWLHLTIAGLALVDQALTFGRTTFLALAVLLPVVFWILPGTRSFILRKWKVWAAFAVVAIAAAALTPSVGQTLVDRVSANPLHDSTVRWRVGSFEAALSGFRSGEWQGARLAYGANVLSDPGFEQGTSDWGIQGGTMSSVRPPFLSYGRRALQFETVGEIPDEGPYTQPVLAKAGQTWRFSVWLRGGNGGEELNVGVWEYGNAGTHTGYTNLPVVLTRDLTHYVIQVTVTNPDTTHVRAILRTRSDAQQATVYADEAYLISVPPLTRSAASANTLANPSFERGTENWSIQGGELSSVPQTVPALGFAAAQMTTSGDVADEGMYSEPIAAHSGDDWTFSIWLRGTTGFEVVDVALWGYDARGETTEQAVAPVVLSPELRQYYVRARISKPETTSIRALVRTSSSPQEIQIVVDGAELARAEKNAAATTGANSSAEAATKETTSLDEPLLGLGFGRSFNYIWNGAVYHLDGDPHNSYIWILAGGGVFALAALLVLLAVFLRDSLRRLRGAVDLQRALILWALGTWFVFMVNTLTGPILSDPNFLLTIWIAMLLPALVRPSRGDTSR
jgi:O-antigen ligase